MYLNWFLSEKEIQQGIEELENKAKPLKKFVAEKGASNGESKATGDIEKKKQSLKVATDKIEGWKKKVRESGFKLKLKSR